MPDFLTAEGCRSLDCDMPYTSRGFLTQLPGEVLMGITGGFGYDGLNGTRKIGHNRPSYAKIRRTVVRHIQVHLYSREKHFSVVKLP